MEEGESARWDDFVISNPDSDYTHLYRWKNVFEESYSLKTKYLGIFNDDILIGLMPTVSIKYPFRKTISFSLPYLNYSGLICNDHYEEELLLKEILNYLLNKKIAGIEIRELSKKNGIGENVTLKLSLPSKAEVLWESFKPKVRNQIRKAEKAGITIKWGVNHLDDFYKVYSRNMHDLGTPVHGRRFFECIIGNFPQYVNLLTAFKENKPVASMLIMKFRDRISDPWASSLKEYLEFCPNMLMYWEALKFGVQYGFKEFDFGRSQVGSGTYNFKTQWGSVPVWLKYKKISVEGESDLTSTSFYKKESAQYFTSGWKILPGFLTDHLGPLLRKYLP